MRWDHGSQKDADASLLRASRSGYGANVKGTQTGMSMLRGVTDLIGVRVGDLIWVGLLVF